ncbi:MAG: hypothetical protein KJ002_08125 [Candidatus Dadabacteria bacterium]|nr:hypothetical protein [Candidatus Dadabacteria bacterium]
MQAFAGFGPNNFFDPIDNTDTGADRLIYYYDQLGRETFVQVTNTSDSFVTIHVQVFEVDEFCNEIDFFLDLTPAQTVVLDMAALPGSPDLTDSYGIVGVTVVDSEFSNAIIGSFRIIDSEGYEYRTNAASTEGEFEFTPGEFWNVLNFNNVNDPAFSDVVGITYVALPSGNIYASPGVGTQFGTGAEDQILIFDHAENFNSCSPVTFACDPVLINRGIDNSVPNTQGFDRICNTSKLEGDATPVDSGWLLLPFIGNICIDPAVEAGGTAGDGSCLYPTYFVGYLGLNNGDGTGSMDSWISEPDFIEIINGGPIAAEAE